MCMQVWRVNKAPLSNNAPKSSYHRSTSRRQQGFFKELLLHVKFSLKLLTSLSNLFKIWLAKGAIDAWVNWQNSIFDQNGLTPLLDRIYP